MAVGEGELCIRDSVVPVLVPQEVDRGWNIRVARVSDQSQPVRRPEKVRHRASWMSIQDAFDGLYVSRRTPSPQASRNARYLCLGTLLSELAFSHHLLGLNPNDTQLRQRCPIERMVCLDGDVNRRRFSVTFVV